MDLTFVRTSDAVGTQPSVVIDRQGRPYATTEAYHARWRLQRISTTVKVYKLGWCSGPRFPTIACAGYGLALRPASDQHPRGQRLSLGRTQNEFLF